MNTELTPIKFGTDGWRAVIDLNLNGTWNVCSRFIRHMMERQTGSIVNVAHVFSFDRGAPMFAHSGAARAGVVEWFQQNQTATFNPDAEVTHEEIFDVETASPNMI